MKNFKKLIKEAHLGNPLNEDYNRMHNVELNALYKNKLGVKDTKGLTRDDLIRGLKFHEASIKMFDGKKFDELDISQKQKLLSYMNRDTEKEFERRMAMREEFSSTEQKMIKQIKSYKKRGSAMVTLPSKVRDFYFKNKEKIDALNEELKLGVKYELPTGETGYIMTGGSKDPKDWKFTGNKEPYLSVKDKLKPTEKQPGKYDGVDFMDENINDPVLVKTRAAQMKRDAMDKKDLENKSKRISVDKAIDLRYELSILDKEREDILMRIEDIAVEMDQTAEPEGGPIADELGERLMAAQRELRAIDSKIIDIKDDLGVFNMNESVKEAEIPLWLTDNREFEKAVIVSTSYNDFEKRAYHILGPKYFKLTLTQHPGVFKDYYDSIRDNKPKYPVNLDEDDELNVNVDNANDNYAKAIDAESRSGAYESLQESLRKKLRERLK